MKRVIILYYGVMSKFSKTSCFYICCRSEFWNVPGAPSMVLKMFAQNDLFYDKTKRHQPKILKVKM